MPLELADRGGDQRDSKAQRRVRDGEARGEIVGAVEDRVMPGEQRAGIDGIDADETGRRLDMGIEA